MRWEPDFGIALPNTAGVEASLSEPQRAAVISLLVCQRPNLTQCLTEVSFSNKP